MCTERHFAFYEVLPSLVVISTTARMLGFSIGICTMLLAIRTGTTGLDYLLRKFYFTSSSMPLGKNKSNWISLVASFKQKTDRQK